MAAKKTGRAKPKTTSKTTTAKMPALIPRPNGRGALRAGGTPGNRGGPGVPPSELRRRLRGSFAERVTIIEDIADGAPVKRVQLRILDLLPYVRCPKCKGSLKAESIEDALTEITILESASPKDRLAALDMQAKYGLGVKDELTVVSPDVQERLNRLVDGLVRLLPPELLTPVRQLMDEVWNDG